MNALIHFLSQETDGKPDAILMLVTEIWSDGQEVIIFESENKEQKLTGTI